MVLVAVGLQRATALPIFTGLETSRDRSSNGCEFEQQERTALGPGMMKGLLLTPRGFT